MPPGARCPPMGTLDAKERDALRTDQFAYVDSDGDFVMEGYYPWPYQRQGLANFLEAWHGDMERAFSVEHIFDFVN